MPNWCHNKVIFEHNDPAQVNRLMKAFEDESPFAEFVPIPNPDEWYDFCLANWGTKWDVTSYDLHETDGRHINISFDTAWSPPIEWYDKMVKMGWKISAYYYEPGVAFCGTYTDESGNEEYSLDGSAESVRENIPRDIDDMFSITEQMRQWEEDEHEDF